MPRSEKRLGIVARARQILEQDHPMTFRAVCYRLFSEGLIESMAHKHTKDVSKYLVAAREEGDIPSDWMEQTQRPILKVWTWANPAAYAEDMRDGYTRDKWQDQACRILVLSEKETIAVTVMPVLNEHEVYYCFTGGTMSFPRAKQIARMADPDHELAILYLGDFDPTGMYMSEVDAPSRLASYLEVEGAPSRREVRDWPLDQALAFLEEHGIRFKRIGLLREHGRQIGQQLSFPATEKETDKNFDWFMAQRYGSRCWELDAMRPQVLRALLNAAILEEKDADAWEQSEEAEEREQDRINEIWDQVAEIDEGQGPDQE